MRLAIRSAAPKWAMAAVIVALTLLMAGGTLRVGETDPAIRRLLPDLPPLPFPVWLVTHRDLRTSLKVRTVFDLLAAGLALHA